MDPTDLTLEVLKSIRDEVRETRTELSGLGRRVVESEIRTSTAVADLHGTVRDLVDVLRAQHDVRPRLDRAEHEITEIKQRLGM